MKNNHQQQNQSVMKTNPQEGASPANKKQKKILSSSSTTSIDVAAAGINTATSTDATKAPALPVINAIKSALSKEDQVFISKREEMLNQSQLERFKALVELEEYRDGIVWQPYGSFLAYAKDRLGFEKAHIFRALAAGKFLAGVEKLNSTESPVTEIQIRHVLGKIPESHQLSCWETIAPKGTDMQKLTGPKVKEAVHKYFKSLPKDVQTTKATRKPKAEAKAPVTLDPGHYVDGLRRSAEQLRHADRILELLSEIETLINAESLHVETPGIASSITPPEEPHDQLAA